MPRKTILVTQGLGHMGAQAAGELNASGYDVITGGFGNLPFGIRSRFAREHYCVSGRSAPDLQATLLDLVRRTKPAAVLPLGSWFTHACIVCRDRIEATSAVNVPDLDAFFAAFDKRQCMKECGRLGIPHPRVYTFAEADQMLCDAKRSETLVVKPHIDAGWAYNVSYVRDQRELRQAFEQCLTAYGDALIEEYIPGPAEAMKCVTLLFSPDAKLVAAFTMQKLRQVPATGGVTGMGVSAADEALVRLVLPFFERWKWRGGAEVELKFDARDGLHKVIEINPRFPAYLGFIAQCGLHMSQLAIELSLDSSSQKAIDYPGYQTNVTGYCGAGLMLKCMIGDLRHNRSVLATWQVLAADLKPAWILLGRILRDPLPIVGRELLRLRAQQDAEVAFWPVRP